MRFDLGECGFHIGELTFHRESKRWHGALHALQDVNADEVNQAFFAVCLAKEALPTPNPGAIFCIVSRLLVGEHIPKRGVRCQGESTDLIIDFADGPELPGAVYVGLVIDRLEPFREGSRLGGTVILFDMLARPGNGKQVEQFEIIEAEHLNETRRGAVNLFRREPAVKLDLGFTDGCLDAGDAVIEERGVVPLRDKRDLVFQVGEAIVHRRGG